MPLISLSQFVEKYKNKAVDFDKQYGFQCVDLFNYYNKEVIGAPFIGTPATGGARDLYEVQNAVRDKYYKKLPATAKVQPGDVIIGGEPHGRYVVNKKAIYLGHVQIAIDSKKAINQNGKLAQKTTIDDSIRVGRLGILRPLRNIAPPAGTPSSPLKKIPVTEKPSYEAIPLKTYYTIKKGDTFWGLENAWQLPHGTLQRLNPTHKPKELQIGSRIRRT